MKNSFPGIIRFIGSAVLRFIYGKSYESRWYSDYYSGAKKVEALLSLCSVLWLFVMIYLLFFTVEPGTWHVIFYAVGYPFALAVWFLMVRKKQG